MKIISWNINGLRSIIEKGFWEKVKKENPHIICLQETKISHEQIEAIFSQQTEYYYYYSCAVKKGYSGVSFLIHHSVPRPKSVQLGLGLSEFDDEGRTIILEFNSFILIGAYFPNGQRDHQRVPYKLKHSYTLLELMNSLKNKKKKEIILCGDINTAHQEIDLANPKSNSNTTGFLPIERTFISKMLENNYIDTFRFIHGNKKDQYTWWTYRSDCRARNIGWRIDYFFVSDQLKNLIEDSYHLPTITGSDHCPIVLKIKLT